MTETGRTFLLRSLLGIEGRGNRKSAPLVLWLGSSLVIGLVVLPVVYLGLRVATNNNQVLQLLQSSNMLRTLARTLGLAIAVSLSSVLIAVPLAWLTTRSDLPLRKMWALLTVLPMVIPSYIGAYLFVAAFASGGLLSAWLTRFLGAGRMPSIYGFSGSWIVLTLLCYPTVLLAVRAALLGLDPRLEEVSRSLGTSNWQTFWRVTFPQLWPALGGSSLLVGLYVLRDFGAVSMLRYDTFTRVIYIQYKSAFDRSSAAGLALILALLSLLMLALEMRLRSRMQNDHLAQPDRRNVHPPVLLGKWRWPALLLTAAIVVLALALPLGVLLYWLVRGLIAGEVLVSLWGNTGNALLASGLAALATTAAALPVALLVVRYPGRASRWVERLSYSGYGLPGIVIALALVFFVSNFALPLYGSLLVLIAAYMILFLPQATGSISTSLLQVHRSLEEAARSLGRKPGDVFLQITLPLIRPGLYSGAAMVFLTTMKELPATLLLSPLGFSTLATSVWSSISEAFFAQAAAPALLLVLVSSLPLAFFMKSEKHEHTDR